MARAAGARREEADALITRFVCRGVVGDEQGTRALIEEARGQTLETFDGDVVRRFYTNSAYVLYGFARYEEALAVALEGIEAETRAGTNPHGQLCVHENGADLMCMLGRPSDAAELLGDEDGAVRADMIAMHQTVAQIAMMQGELDAAARRIRVPRSRRPGARVLVPTCTTAAEIALWRGESRSRWRHPRGGGSDRRRRSDRGGQLLACRCGRRPTRRRPACWMARKPSRGQPPAGAAGEARRDGGPPPGARRAAADRRRGALAARGEARSARLAGRDRGMGGDQPAVRGGLRGLALGAGARRRCTERAESSSRTYAPPMRARPAATPQLAAAIEALARRARVALPGMDEGGDAPFADLTEREREVLALVADGRTNREIADKLFITEKTASVHVSNILGQAGRVQPRRGRRDGAPRRARQPVPSGMQERKPTREGVVAQDALAREARSLGQALHRSVLGEGAQFDPVQAAARPVPTRPTARSPRVRLRAGETGAARGCSARRAGWARRSPTRPTSPISSSLCGWTIANQ